MLCVVVVATYKRLLEDMKPSIRSPKTPVTPPANKRLLFRLSRPGSLRKVVDYIIFTSVIRPYSFLAHTCQASA